MRKVLPLAIIGALLLIPVGALSSDPEACMECHGLTLISRKDATKEKLIYLEAESRKISKHKETYCSDCHTDVTHVPHPTTPETVSCIERCHQKTDDETVREKHVKKYYTYQEDVHFFNRYNCKICHNDFSSMSRQNASLMCVGCHGKDQPGGRELLYSTPVHGKLIGEDADVLCIDCHTAHVGKRNDGGKTSASSNCFRGAECHGEQILKKGYLGGHVQKKGKGILLAGIQLLSQIICIFFVILGTAIVYRRKGEKDG